MKKFSRITALVLVVAMSLAMVSFAAFTDESAIKPEYKLAVDRLVQLKIVSGYPDGSFKPQKNITRAEFSKMAYVFDFGADLESEIHAAKESSFKDVEGNGSVAWAKGYINYCFDKGFVSGVGDNKFAPAGNITVGAVVKMLLCIIGYDAEEEGLVGNEWLKNVKRLGDQTGILENISADLNSLATRELVCQLMSQTLFANTEVPAKTK